MGNSKFKQINLRQNGRRSFELRVLNSIAIKYYRRINV